jgi:hypothetical protein
MGPVPTNGHTAKNAKDVAFLLHSAPDPKVQQELAEYRSSYTSGPFEVLEKGVFRDDYGKETGRPHVRVRWQGIELHIPQDLLYSDRGSSNV